MAIFNIAPDIKQQNIESKKFEKELKKRMDFAFKDIRTKMRKNDFWKPLLTKQKRKKNA